MHEIVDIMAVIAHYKDLVVNLPQLDPKQTSLREFYDLLVAVTN